MQKIFSLLSLGKYHTKKQAPLPPRRPHTQVAEETNTEPIVTRVSA